MRIIRNGRYEQIMYRDGQSPAAPKAYPFFSLRNDSVLTILILLDHTLSLIVHGPVILTFRSFSRPITVYVDRRLALTYRGNMPAYPSIHSGWAGRLALGPAASTGWQPQVHRRSPAATGHDGGCGGGGGDYGGRSAWTGGAFRPSPSPPHSPAQQASWAAGGAACGSASATGAAAAAAGGAWPHHPSVPAPSASRAEARPGWPAAARVEAYRPGQDGQGPVARGRGDGRSGGGCGGGGGGCGGGGGGEHPPRQWQGGGGDSRDCGPRQGPAAGRIPAQAGPSAVPYWGDFAPPDRGRGPAGPYPGSAQPQTPAPAPPPSASWLPPAAAGGDDSDPFRADWPHW